ncbi:hypothetical protein GMOD_00004379 [Pyrenophora seminiperda CCB06]|uniref:Uncharacterized protein n=1 Tax=Pyrenophora seminiperda CCB06 TaxID=1302712 RepID=A0A3M7M0Z2_9PLEO|nr:hypothetical protein GMOD_00004379 [Pyrenophora seminiperda CCB06]
MVTMRGTLIQTMYRERANGADRTTPVMMKMTPRDWTSKVRLLSDQICGLRISPAVPTQQSPPIWNYHINNHAAFYAASISSSELRGGEL